MGYLALATVLIATMSLPVDAYAQSREIVPDVVYGHKDGMALKKFSACPQVSGWELQGTNLTGVILINGLSSRSIP